MLNRILGLLKLDRESLNNLFFTIKVAGTVTVVSTGLFTSYIFYKNDLNISKSIKDFNRISHKIRYGEFKFRKTPDSFYMLSLSDRLAYNISIYFIQLDLDKKNGVTFADLSNIWTRFELDSDHLERFIAENQSGIPNDRLLSGCPLQIFGEAFESLILKHRIVDRESADELELSICTKFEEINKMTKTPENIRFSLSNPYISASLDQISDKILTVKKSKIVEEAEIKRNILELETQLNALERQISQHKLVKNPLTFAEQERINIFQQQANELKNEIKILKSGLNSWF